MRLNTLTQASTIMKSIWEMPGSNPDRNTSYPDWCFYVVSSVPPGTFQDRMLNEVTVTSTYFPFHSTLCSLRYCSLPTWCWLTYSLPLRPSEILGFLYHRRLFFPVECPPSPSLNIPLSQISLHIFQLSESSSSPSSTSLRLTLKYFLNCPSLIHSYYMSNPFQSLLFNICYYA